MADVFSYCSEQNISSSVKTVQNSKMDVTGSLMEVGVHSGVEYRPPMIQVLQGSTIETRSNESYGVEMMEDEISLGHDAIIWDEANQAEIYGMKDEFIFKHTDQKDGSLALNACNDAKLLDDPDKKVKSILQHDPVIKDEASLVDETGKKVEIVLEQDHGFGDEANLVDDHGKKDKVILLQHNPEQDHGFGDEANLVDGPGKKDKVILLQHHPEQDHGFGDEANLMDDPGKKDKVILLQHNIVTNVEANLVAESGKEKIEHGLDISDEDNLVVVLEHGSVIGGKANLVDDRVICDEATVVDPGICDEANLVPDLDKKVEMIPKHDPGIGDDAIFEETNTDPTTGDETRHVVDNSAVNVAIDTSVEFSANFKDDVSPAIDNDVDAEGCLSVTGGIWHESYLQDLAPRTAELLHTFMSYGSKCIPRTSGEQSDGLGRKPGITSVEFSTNFKDDASPAIDNDVAAEEYLSVTGGIWHESCLQVLAPRTAELLHTFMVVIVEKGSVYATLSDIYKLEKYRFLPLNEIKYAFKGEPGEGLGPTKQALTLYHTEGKNQLYEGDSECIPRTSGDQSEALGRILYHTFRFTGGFPSFICKAFIFNLLTGQDIKLNDEECLIKSYVNYLSVSGDDKLILLSALNGGLQKMSGKSKSKLFEIINREKDFKIAQNVVPDSFKECADETNWRQVLIDLANLDINEKTACKSVAQEFQLCMGECELYSVNEAKAFINKMNPKPQSIRDMIKTPLELTDNMKKVYGYLCRFITSNCDNPKMAEQFLMYFTASTSLPLTPITVDFNVEAITACTCADMIQLPTTYESYKDFELEMLTLINDDAIFTQA